jgi:hypothetical protein
MIARGIIVQQLVKPQAHTGADRGNMLTQVTRIATSLPSVTGLDLALAREDDATNFAAIDAGQ